MANKHRTRSGRTIYLWVLALILIGASVWGVSAKYVQQQEQEILVQAKMFYFTSDLLTENGAEYEINANTESIRFDLNNFADALRFSEVDVQYDVYINDVKLGQTDMLPAGQKETASITFDVEPGNTYTVRAEGNAGYTKVLSATFTVAARPTGFYKHLADSPNNPYLLLTVWTEDLSGEVTVAFPAGLIPDTTDPDLANIQNAVGDSYDAYTTGSVSLGKFSSKTYRFFKEQPAAVYSVDDFSATMGSQSAEPGTP